MSCRLTSIGIPIMDIRLSRDVLIFISETPCLKTFSILRLDPADQVGTFRRTLWSSESDLSDPIVTSREHHGVSNYRDWQLDGLFTRFFRLSSKKTSELVITGLVLVKSVASDPKSVSIIFQDAIMDNPERNGFLTSRPTYLHFGVLLGDLLSPFLAIPILVLPSSLFWPLRDLSGACAPPTNSAFDKNRTSVIRIFNSKSDKRTVNILKT